MTTRRLAAGGTALVLATISGCASGPSSYAEARSEQSGGRGGVFSDEVVIGVFYDDRGVPRYSGEPGSMTMEQIAAELVAMRDLDQELVRESTGGVVLAPAEVARIAEIDRAHGERLAEIVDAIGWPTREQVGVAGAQGAFVVIQHAGHNPELQNRCLTLMVDQVEQGRLPAPYVALLTDRVRMFAGQPQVFGTQMTFVTDGSGVARCAPAVEIEEPGTLDARRALMGLPPHAAFIAQLETAYQTQHGGAFASVLVE
jgi:hypothetical protein